MNFFCLDLHFSPVRLLNWCTAGDGGGEEETK